MIAILAGAMLWAYVVIVSLLGNKLDGTATVILLGLGAVLFASSGIEVFKISAAGFELRTRTPKSPTLNINIRFPRLDPLKVAFWLLVMTTVGLFISRLVIDALYYSRYGRHDSYLSESLSNDTAIALSFTLLTFAVLSLRALIRWLRGKRQVGPSVNDIHRSTETDES